MADKKFIQLHLANDAFADRYEETNHFALSFPSDQGGCTAVLDRPTLERLQIQIAHLLSQEATDGSAG